MHWLRSVHHMHTCAWCRWRLPALASRGFSASFFPAASDDGADCAEWSSTGRGFKRQAGGLVSRHVTVRSPCDGTLSDGEYRGGARPCKPARTEWVFAFHVEARDGINPPPTPGHNIRHYMTWHSAPRRPGRRDIGPFGAIVKRMSRI